MASNTLYRKYRPQNFSEIIGQKHIVQTLTNAIKHGRIGQAYLFTGPRGTGKTSIARIFAKTVNCEKAKDGVKCEKCPNCLQIQNGTSLDIIEIDAASNTGVDNIRELRETVALPPTSLKYKVYIIDEVHMLSTGAFNALLKTLEEPPSHVIFILATTEIHKVPETILSRCQRFDFSRLPISAIIEKLSLIAKAEKVSIDKDSLEMIAISAEGGMRDAESLLGQVMTLEDKKITIKEVEEILGTADRKFSKDLAGMLIRNDATGAIELVNSLLEDGYDLKVFTKALINYLRQLMLLRINPQLRAHFSYELTQEQLKEMEALAGSADLKKLIISINLFLDAQGKISSAMLPQLPIEIAIIRATHTFPAEIVTSNQKPVTSNPPEKQIEKKEPELRVTSYELPKPAATEKPDKSVVAPITDQPSKIVMTYDIQSNWGKILEAIKPHNHSLQALLFSCQVVSVENNRVTLATPYDFYKEKLNDPENRRIVEDVLGKIIQAKISIKTVTNKEAGINSLPAREKEANKPAGEQSSLLKSALEIMGGKIVEE